MIDDFALLSTTLCILYVLVRAVALDRSLPWFGDEASPLDGKESYADRKNDFRKL
jgi:hypothetical protein